MNHENTPIPFVFPDGANAEIVVYTKKSLAELLWYGNNLIKYAVDDLKADITAQEKRRNIRTNNTKEWERKVNKMKIIDLCKEMDKYVAFLRNDMAIIATTKDISRYKELTFQEERKYTVESVQKHIRLLQERYQNQSVISPEENKSFISFMEIVLFDICDFLESYLRGHHDGLD